ncbi:probable 28S ribosomal protein S23, mitochondrial [Apis laboriosa]|uniref:probable 28S ribosomal protein S23, mitochondrial n=1 Tax=Apis laboriosa TaxID=183418 RepID=UPI001CC8072B|nr:probable 28S ribosomal protein S23, mitochondrial [Apis laboriosa]
MAQSKTEKIGTIFTRITALVRSEALHPNNLPLWYNIYKSFPPKDEPLFARKPSQKKIQDIFYAEDIIRAKFHKDMELPIIDMKSDNVTQTQIFLSLYKNFLQDNIKEEEAYEKALQNYKETYNAKTIPKS